MPGAGAILGTNNVLKNNCMTLNGQYGFQSTTVDSGGDDSLTTGPYNVNIEDNEISYNDTCDFSGTLDNKAIGWSNHNPVPAQDQNPNCGTVNGDGNEGGFKLWPLMALLSRATTSTTTGGQADGPIPITPILPGLAIQLPITRTQPSSRKSPITSRLPTTTWLAMTGPMVWVIRDSHSLPLSQRER